MPEQTLPDTEKAPGQGWLTCVHREQGTSTGSGGGLSTSQTCTCICSGCTGYSPDVKQSGFQEALNALMVGRTTVVVAHRLSTIEKADRIVVLEKGRIVEIGSHAELLALGGAYAHFYRIQYTLEETPSA